jgi:hypothetical protein
LVEKEKGPYEGAFSYKKPGGDLLSHARSILSLAQNRFTALFGMGRGGSNSLWPPDITGVSWFFTRVNVFNKLEEVKF